MNKIDWANKACDLLEWAALIFKLDVKNGVHDDRVDWLEAAEKLEGLAKEAPDGGSGHPETWRD